MSRGCGLACFGTCSYPNTSRHSLSTGWGWSGTFSEKNKSLKKYSIGGWSWLSASSFANPSEKLLPGQIEVLNYFKILKYLEILKYISRYFKILKYLEILFQDFKISRILKYISRFQDFKILEIYFKISRYFKILEILFQDS